MRALRYERGRLRIAETEKPRAAREALIRVTLAGICNTDLEITRGYAGFEGTLGHEFVGVVESAPDRSLVGQRVVGEINAGCGACQLCRAGDPRHCPRRTVLGIVGRDGAFAEFLQLPIENLHRVPDEIADEEAVFTEPLAAAYGITEQVRLDRQTRTVVIGDGKLGLLCAQALSITGAPITLIGKHDNKLEIAQRRGIETVRLEEFLASDELKRAFDVAVEASGSASGFEIALAALRPRGKLVLKSTFHGDTSFNAARIVVDEVSIIGSRCGRFPPALDLLRRKAVDVKSLISEEYRLVDGLEAMARAAERGVLKILLRP
jgi:threonine dehydrogenase-like Zn-dependent dehydrogenase